MNERSPFNGNGYRGNIHGTSDSQEFCFAMLAARQLGAKAVPERWAADMQVTRIEFNADDSYIGRVGRPT
ncbi:hypothetical protein BHE90_006758 [Fusarium euwallaceae]|uniref:Uncharacterized protein n=3 Tax=Fusarium solani species complex TaxID=232080 RepID=A0A3M2RAI0_9HYPO|nr:hypothetical protein CDV36_015475 [Fusarium kuroshium]RSM16376.1 hypothetical protein CEP52_000266 [Fusarium oligoseptatum]RTE78765.1 hypothetical protein BHE90_006758 [Fusarium euwallaceae]